MLFITALAFLATLSASVLGALPVSGSSYNIQNLQTGLFVDDFGGIITPGNHIIGFPFTGGPNQLWKVTLFASGGASWGVYTFSCALSTAVVSIYAVGVPNNGLTAQGFAIPLNVTVVPGTNQTTITVPTTALAVTTATSSGSQLVLQALVGVTGSNLQRWRFDLSVP
ncbi:hypothetical protein AURDEDRAFT_167614 [Auricularia subglabra TFB-10046 SS5]|nr:hypothetical protein AURDEDRAFT_167614 [Auricularia subglabra TFB-10046 SS5]